MIKVASKKTSDKNSFRLVKIPKPSVLYQKYGFKNGSGFSTSADEVSDILPSSNVTLTKVISLENEMSKLD